MSQDVSSYFRGPEYARRPHAHEVEGHEHDGDLFGIQNSTNPGRVVRIALADKGSRVAGLTVLQSHHHPDFDEPTTGAIANGALNVIGNSYVGHYQPDGSIKDAAELKGTAIVAVPLGVPSAH